MTVLRVRAYYLEHAFADEAEIVSQAKNSLKDVEFDSFVGTGISGAVIIPILARAMNKNWMIVRKQSDNCHSYSKVEGELGASWIFVDDLIDSGQTRKRVKEMIRNLAIDAEHKTKYMGDYLYARQPDGEDPGFCRADPEPRDYADQLISNKFDPFGHLGLRLGRRNGS